MCLEGAIDFHVHSSPDVVPRKHDDVELAAQAAAAGMGGLVLKSHHVSTVGRAALAHRVVPDVSVFGGLVLNGFVGGLNPKVVEIQARLGAKTVWLPTVDATHDRAHLNEPGRGEVPSWMALRRELAANGRLSDPIRVIHESGAIVKEFAAVLEVVRDYDLILGTARLHASEMLHVVPQPGK